MFKVDKKFLIQKLWGDNYYDASVKQWITTDTGADGKKLKRGFVEYIMDPIIRLVKNIMDNNKETVFKIVAKLGLTLSQEEQQLEKKNLMKNVFMKWLNAADALLEMIVAKLPSPVTAQTYRTKFLYEGPLDDPCAQAM
jgi:elongation factor 2